MGVLPMLTAYRTKQDVYATVRQFPVWIDRFSASNVFPLNQFWNFIRCVIGTVLLLCWEIERNNFKGAIHILDTNK